MSVASDIQEQIERSIAELPEKEYIRPSMTVDQFVAEFAGTISQAKVDREQLERSGFDWGKMILIQALYDNLLDACRDRTIALLNTPRVIADFDELMQLALNDRKVLKEVASAIILEANDPNLTRLVRGWLAGNGRNKLLTCNLNLVSLINDYPSVAAWIKPGGVLVDGDFLEQAGNRAVALLRMQGLILRNGKPENAAVDRQRSLLTLCIREQKMIKRFAHAAFIDNLEYYKQYYCSHVRRERDKRYASKKRAAALCSEEEHHLAAEV